MLLKNLETGLAWLWVLAVVTTVLDLLGVLQFANRAVASGVHGGVWVLAWVAVAHWHWWRPLPWLLWVGLLGVAALWLISPMLNVFGFLTQIPGKLAYSFFLDSGQDALWRWENTHVSLQRGRALVVRQDYATMPGFNGGGDVRIVQLVPITPLWHWVRQVPAAERNPAAYAARVAQGWVPVECDWADFSFDPTEQARLAADRARRDAEDLRAQQAFEADSTNSSLIEAVKRDAEMNRRLDSLNAATRRSDD